MDAETLKQIVGSPYFAVGGLIFTVVGVAAAVFFYYRAKREKKPIVQVSTTVLVEGLAHALEGLSVAFNGTQQDRITVTKLAFWNDGRETIHGADIAAADPLRIAVESASILDARIIKYKTASNQFALQKVEGTYQLHWDYVDKGDYVLLQVVHDGDAKTPVKIVGKIKGCDKITKFDDPGALIATAKPTHLDRLMSRPEFLRWAGFLTYGVVGASGIALLLKDQSRWYWWLLAGFGIFAALVMLFGYRQRSPVDLR